MRAIVLVAILGTFPSVVLADEPPPSGTEESSPPKKVDADRVSGGAAGLGFGANRLPGYLVTWAPLREVENSASELGWVRQQLNVGAPLWIDGPNKLFAQVSVGHWLFQGDARFPGPRTDFPDQLWDVRVGGGYIRDLGDRWTTGLFLNVGSSSDLPFHGLRELNVSLIGFLRVPAGDRNAWNFSLFYSPLGQLPFPIPGISYYWAPNDQFQANLGIPFSLLWRPTEDLRFEMSYLPVTNVRARMTYKVMQQIEVYGSAEWANDSFFLADRTDRRERFFIDEKRLELGVTVRPAGRWLIQAAGGYAFDRELFRTQDGFFDRNDVDRIRVGGTAYLQFRVGIEF